ncbi:hypothetical protein BDZ94DRAFT_1308555 [Collybia nuda]|uniref:Uncharacterized protein n=1 Tax=Collybia nuda TaxID=64659 RepID=A0A9P5Y7F3_9AGAR|nr:hypothetical protein BDZ94DRAFT_1308555 [Collybia nuda]
MAFYKDDVAWTNVLNNAKEEFQLWIHSQVGFQEHTEVALQIAWDFVLEAISKYQDDPYNIEPLNKCLYNKQAMSILIFKEGAMTCGALKTLC